ncbi:MAG: hypothetical protein M3Z14_01055 [Candidatus Eremiobacteraeota bacterium]|nr:hypothetical protein [Candidatus Eremiobacteraeota bacterium]
MPGGGSTPGGGPPPTAPSIGSIVLSITGSPVAGVSGTFAVTVTVKDKNGKLITGTYPVPITLSDSDQSGTTMLLTTTVANSTTQVLLTYNGKPLSSAAIITPFAAGVPSSAITPAQFVLGSSAPVVSSIVLSISGFAIAGVAGTFPLTVTVKDQSGKVITGSYPVAIALLDSDSSGTTSLSTATLINSTTSVMLNYNGNLLPSGATIGASASGIPATSVTPAEFTVNAQNPLGNGASFTYSVSETNTQLPVGSPQTSTFTDKEALTTGAAFNGQTNLIDIHDIDTPINPAPVPNFTSVEDQYLKWVPSGNGARLLEVGYAFTHGDSNSSTSGTTAWSPGSIVDELPQTQGNSWNPLSASVYSDKTVYPTGEVTTSDIRTNADGSYTKNFRDTIPDAGSESVYTDNYIVSANGTFIYKFGSIDTHPSSLYDVLNVFSSSAPSMASGGMVIPIQDNCQTGAAPFPGTPPPGGFPAACNDSSGATQQNSITNTNVPDWFPFPGGSAQSPLYVAKVTVNGTGNIPAECKTPPSIATSAVDEHYKETDLDPAGVLTYYTEDFYYSPNVGLVCHTYNNFLEFFDFLSTGTVTQEIQTTGVQGLTAYHQPLNATRRPASVGRQGTAVPMMMAFMIHRTHEAVRRQISRVRMHRHRRSRRH